MRSYQTKESNGLPSDLLLSFVFEPTGTTPAIQVYNGEQQVGQTTELWRAFRYFEWQLDVFLADAIKDYYLVHAGVVSKNGAGIILPAVSGSGKSSLTLALLQKGYRYFSDELAVINPNTAQLSTFPKPFSLKSPWLFPDLARQKNLWLGPASFAPEPFSAGLDDKRSRRVWYIHPDDVKPQAVAQSPVPIRFIIFPTYQANAKPQLQSLSANLALRKLIENSVNLSNLGEGSLSLLSKLVQEAQCFTLTVNDLEETTALIEAVVSR